MKKIILILIAAFVFNACNDDSSEENIIEKDTSSNPNSQDTTANPGYLEKVTGNLINYYVIPTSIEIRNSDTFSDTLENNFIVMDLFDESHFKEWDYSFITNNIIGYPSNGKFPNTANYKKYAEYYGDTTYTGTQPFGNYYVSVYPISNITITADKDFDESHPANTSLNDIFRVETLLVYDFIQNGYYMPNGEPSLRASYDIDMSKFNGLKLPCNWFVFDFTKIPDNQGTYTFTISIKFDQDPITGETLQLEPVTATFVKK